MSSNAKSTTSRSRPGRRIAPDSPTSISGGRSSRRGGCLPVGCKQSSRCRPTARWPESEDVANASTRTRSPASAHGHDRVRGKAITRPRRVARLFAVESNPGTAAVAAGPRDRGRAVDGAWSLATWRGARSSASSQLRSLSVERDIHSSQVGPGSSPRIVPPPAAIVGRAASQAHVGSEAPRPPRLNGPLPPGFRSSFEC
jgi:hypothetical protein